MEDNYPKEQIALELAVELVSAYVTNHTIEIDELPKLVQTMYNYLTDLSKMPAFLRERPAPAVAIDKSITPDYIICLEDGKRLKMLKRHIKTSYNMTPQQYRERWGLPSDYPMVAPNYAQRRSNLARSIGLGHSRRRLKKAS